MRRRTKRETLIALAAKLPPWIVAMEACCGAHHLRRVARTLRGDIDAVRSALTEQWSNGQTEGQIDRLKTLKRAMYGRAGPELLRAYAAIVGASATEFEAEPI